MARKTFQDGFSLPAVELNTEFARTLQNCDAWVSGTAYVKNDVVTYAGTDYRALQPSTNVVPSSSTIKWKALGGGTGGGSGGPDPDAVHNRGVWDAGADYLANDLVIHSDAVFLALSPSTNSEPGDGNADWKRFDADAPLLYFLDTVNQFDGVQYLQFANAQGTQSGYELVIRTFNLYNDESDFNAHLAGLPNGMFYAYVDGDNYRAGIIIEGNPLPFGDSDGGSATEPDAPAHFVKAGPESGADASPAYRALVAGDIPALTLAKISDAATALATKADLVSGFVPIEQIPVSLLGALRYQSAWNASTNTPTIPAAASANKGYYYRVATAGTTSISGISDWGVGDWLVSNGASWDKIDNSEIANDDTTTTAQDPTDGNTVKSLRTVLTNLGALIAANVTAIAGKADKLLANLTTASDRATARTNLGLDVRSGESIFLPFPPAATTATGAAGGTYVTRVTVERKISVSKLAFQITVNTSNNTIGVGFYDASGNLLFQSGAQTGTGVKTATLGSAVDLPVGEYWLAFTANDTAIQFVGINSLLLSATGLTAMSGTAANSPTTAGVLPATLGAITPTARPAVVLRLQAA